MSTKTRLLALTDGLKMPEQGAQAETGGTVRGPSPDPSTVPTSVAAGTKFPPVVPGVAAARTGPGQMLQFRGQMLAVEGEVSKLRDELKRHEGSLPTRKLDPKVVFPSQWANRHPASFESPKFASLKADIEAAGGNVQAILVRPAGEGTYEIIFGHRRHRACLDLGLQVLAAIYTGPLSDVDLFGMMERENRERADLSPFEQGTTYRKALDEHLYPSQRRLAEGLGVSHTWVGKTLVVADLPGVVIECFRSPLEIQHRHAEQLNAALEADRKGVLRRAEKLSQVTQKPAAASVVAGLIASSGQGAEPKVHQLLAAGKKVGSWSRDRKGGVTIVLNSGAVPDERLEEVLGAFEKVIAEGN